MPSRDRAVSSRSRVSWRAELRRNFDDAIRQVRRAPGFCAVVVVTLAVGLAATTAVFSLVDGLLLRPLPVRDPERLATIASRTEISQGRLAGGGGATPCGSAFAPVGASSMASSPGDPPG